ncbi:MAG: CBS domain-containing protein [Thermomicrobiales bacterium]
MTSENLITVPVGTTLEQAEEILHQNKVEKLPVVDDDFILKGLITVKDIQKRRLFPNATKDERGRLCVAAGVGVGQDGLHERAEALIMAGRRHCRRYGSRVCPCRRRNGRARSRAGGTSRLSPATSRPGKLPRR